MAKLIELIVIFAQSIRLKYPYPHPHSMKTFYSTIPSNINTFNLSAMEKKPRSLTVSESATYHPRIILTGAWLKDWGFAKGDQLLVSQTSTRDILIKVATPKNEWPAISRKEDEIGPTSPPMIFSPARLRVMRKQNEIATAALRRFIAARGPKRLARK
jgi:hypothetical protein